RTSGRTEPNHQPNRTEPSAEPNQPNYCPNQ
ncbi:hypothetical protein BpHYR1_040840, partial [Brachionus plicatilis]